MANQAIHKHSISQRFACRVFHISASCYRYRGRHDSENELIADWLLRLTTTHKRWGFGLCFLYLRNTQGFHWNHKRAYRIYCQLELNLRIKPKRRIQRNKPDALQVPKQTNQVWSMDFMSDALACGRRFRTFNIVDDFNREALHIEVDTSINSARLVRVFEQIKRDHGLPQVLRSDNGPEFLGEMFTSWAKANGVAMRYIQPGKPNQNAYIERFNKTYRNQILDAYIFESLDEVRSVTEEWVRDYNYERPHDSLGGLSPVMWKNGQQAKAKASTFPAHFSTSDNNNSENSRKNSTFEAY